MGVLGHVRGIPTRPVDDQLSGTPSFEQYVSANGDRLLHILTARYGPDVASDVYHDALIKAWEPWSRVGAYRNPGGFLYRAAQSAARKHHRWLRELNFPTEYPELPDRSSERIDLGRALERLRPTPRMCVVLVHVYGYSYDEAATILDISPTAVRNNTHRALRRLRQWMNP